jgi:hypothetical protein
MLTRFLVKDYAQRVKSRDEFGREKKIPLMQLEGKRFAAEKRRCEVAFYMFEPGEKKEYPLTCTKAPTDEITRCSCDPTLLIFTR